MFAYLRGQWRGLGHNPLGAFSVLGLLALMLFQVGSGLVSDDNIAFSWSLKNLVSQDFADLMTGLHQYNVWVIVGLVSLHVLSIIFYGLVKRDNLLLPMIIGTKAVHDPALESARGGGWLAFIVAVAIAGGAVWAASGGLISPPPPPPPAAQEAAPAW